jgi:uncharacterized protein (DUF1684 family)
LFWLEEGENRFGSDPSNQVALPVGAAPPYSGVFIYKEDKIVLRAAEGVTLTMDGKPVTVTQVKLNEYGSSEWILLNELKLSVIQRGTRYGVRVYDPNNPSRKQFVSLHWFPIEEAYRIEAAFIPYDPVQKITIVNVIGDALEMVCPGYAEFTLHGESCRLYAIDSDDDGRLWFMFRDATSGSLTYPGGRYLISPQPEGGKVIVDFNRTYNPPCAYTDFATCPIPPVANRLKVPVMAGELKFH